MLTNLGSVRLWNGMVWVFIIVFFFHNFCVYRFVALTFHLHNGTLLFFLRQFMIASRQIKLRSEVVCLFVSLSSVFCCFRVIIFWETLHGSFWVIKLLLSASTSPYQSTFSVLLAISLHCSGCLRIVLFAFRHAKVLTLLSEAACSFISE